MDERRPLRLAFVADPDSVHTRRWIAWFADAGHDVRLVDPFGVEPAPGLPAGITIERSTPPGRPVPLLGLLDRRRALRRLLDRLGTEVLHAHFVRRYGWQAALSGFRPLVVSPWGSDLLKAGRRQLRTRMWNRFALRSATLVTVSSEGMRDAAIRSGARADRIRLIHHGVDTAAFAPGPPDPALAARLGVDGARVVFSARSIRPLYRQETVVDALALLPEPRPVLVLSARGADGSYLSALRERAARAGMAERLRVLEDVAHDELPRLYRLADVVVSVPESDSFPVTLLEAMACGRPVVASDLPAVTPVLRGLDPLGAELIAPVGDAAATARAIERSLSLEDDDRARLATSLRRHVVEAADYDTNMAAMERLYRQLAAGR